MIRLTNAQAVASGAGSLILFTLTLLAGYALAEVGARSLAPAGTRSGRDESRRIGPNVAPAPMAAQKPGRDMDAAGLRADERAINALATVRDESASPMIAVEDPLARGQFTDAPLVRVRSLAPTIAMPDDRSTFGPTVNAERMGDGRRFRRMPT